MGLNKKSGSGYPPVWRNAYLNWRIELLSFLKIHYSVIISGMFILCIKQISPVMVCHRYFYLLKPLQVPSTKAKFSPSSRALLQKPSALCPGASGQPKASTRGSQELLQPESSFTLGAKGILCPMAIGSAPHHISSSHQAEHIPATFALT